MGSYQAIMLDIVAQQRIVAEAHKFSFDKVKKASKVHAEHADCRRQWLYGRRARALPGHHPQMNLAALTVSAQSDAAGKLLSELHPQLKGILDLTLQPLDDISVWAKRADVVFLATAHEVSHTTAPQFLADGCVVINLSGAYYVNEVDFYPQNYGFEHQHANWLDRAVYGLAECQEEAIKTAQLIAVPGCYPTAAQLALKLLVARGCLTTNNGR